MTLGKKFLKLNLGQTVACNLLCVHKNLNYRIYKIFCIILFCFNFTPRLNWLLKWKFPNIFTQSTQNEYKFLRLYTFKTRLWCHSYVIADLNFTCGSPILVRFLISKRYQWLRYWKLWKLRKSTMKFIVSVLSTMISTSNTSVWKKYKTVIGLNFDIFHTKLFEVYSHYV